MGKIVLRSYTKSIGVTCTGEKKIVGMVGGKFLPLHLGHKLLIERAFMECDMVYLCMFLNSPDERGVREQWYTHPDFRYYQLTKAAREINRVQSRFYGRTIDYRVLIVDCSLYSKDGIEDWAAEADYIKGIAGHIDKVFSSEPSYDDTFKRIYPGAEHVIVDPKREFTPISGTQIRNMADIEEQVRWMA